MTYFASVPTIDNDTLEHVLESRTIDCFLSVASFSDKRRNVECIGCVVKTDADCLCTCIQLRFFICFSRPAVDVYEKLGARRMAYVIDWRMIRRLAGEPELELF